MTGLKLLLMYLAAIVLMVAFSSCNTYKKRLQKSSQFMIENPVELAKLCADKFPAKETFIKGKIITDTIITTDTVTVTADCPDGTVVECPKHKTKYITNFSTDTIVKVDSALVTSLRTKIRGLEDELLKEQALHQKTKESESEARKTAKNRLFIIIGVGVLVFGGLFFKFKKFFL